MNNAKAAPIIKDRDVQNDLFVTETQELIIATDMFHEMTKGKAYYPNKALTNQIGHHMGIEFSNSIRIEEVYGDEIIHPDGTKTRKQIGIRCIKQGKRRNTDGTYMYSSPCPYDFIYADRTELAILADEEKIGQTYRDGNLKCKYTFPDDPTKQKRVRRQLFLNTKQHAPQRASTGSELMVIRELTGMKTTFTPQEISVGHIKCSQIVLSKEHQEALAAANIFNTKHGGLVADQNNNAIGLLTGTPGDVQGDFNKDFTRPDPVKNQVTPEPVPEIKPDPIIPPVKKKPPGFSPRVNYENALIDSSLDQDWKDFIHTAVSERKYSDMMCKYGIAVLNTKLPEDDIRMLTSTVDQNGYKEHYITQAIDYFIGNKTIPQE